MQLSIGNKNTYFTMGQITMQLSFCFLLCDECVVVFVKAKNKNDELEWFREQVSFRNKMFVQRQVLLEFRYKHNNIDAVNAVIILEIMVCFIEHDI